MTAREEFVKVMQNALRKVGEDWHGVKDHPCDPRPDLRALAVAFINESHQDECLSHRACVDIFLRDCGLEPSDD